MFYKQKCRSSLCLSRAQINLYVQSAWPLLCIIRCVQQIDKHISGHTVRAAFFYPRIEKDKFFHGFIWTVVNRRLHWVPSGPITSNCSTSRRTKFLLAMLWHHECGKRGLAAGARPSATGRQAVADSILLCHTQAEPDSVCPLPFCQTSGRKAASCHRGWVMGRPIVTDWSRFGWGGGGGGWSGADDGARMHSQPTALLS